jgi:SAM-dependent methyltransferase
MTVRRALGRLRLKRADPPTADVATAATLFELLLHRRPPADELESLVARYPRLDELLTTILVSPEFDTQNPLVHLLAPSNESRNRDTDRYEVLLAGRQWTDDVIEARMGELGFSLPSPDFDANRCRWGELFRLLEAHQEGEPVESLLEVGTNPFRTPFYREVLDGVRLVTVDRPEADGGHDAAWAAEAGASEHCTVDLNVGSLSRAQGGPLDGQFDIVVCDAVIQHLLVDPIGLFRDLAALLRPGGVLYLTTVNFLRWEALEAIVHGRNPAPRFDRRVDGDGSGHHFREYTMEELEESAAAAGCTVWLAAYSACGDRPGLAERFGVNRALRGNLVLAIGRAGDEPPGWTRLGASEPIVFPHVGPGETRRGRKPATVVACSIGSGPHERLLELSGPTLRAWAARFDWDVDLRTELPVPERPASWSKLDVVRSHLDTHDIVVWVDADAAVVDPRTDVRGLVDQRQYIALVAHEYAGQWFPNLGVFVVRSCPGARRLIDELWGMEQYRDHKWWENAAFLDLLGFEFEEEPIRKVRTTELDRHVHWLGTEWNSIALDPSPRPIVSHYPAKTQNDRLAALAADAARVRMAAAKAERPVDPSRAREGRAGQQ